MKKKEEYIFQVCDGFPYESLRYASYMGQGFLCLDQTGELKTVVELPLGAQGCHQIKRDLISALGRGEVRDLYKNKKVRKAYVSETAHTYLECEGGTEIYINDEMLALSICYSDPSTGMSYETKFRTDFQEGLQLIMFFHLCEQLGLTGPPSKYPDREMDRHGIELLLEQIAARRGE